MRKTIIIFLWLLSCVAAAAGQEADKQAGVKQPAAKPGRPDLSGSWVLDKGRSDRKPLSTLPEQMSLTIVHREPEVRITERLQLGARDVIRTYVYYTDGRGERNLKAGDESTETKTKWKGRQLVAEGKARLKLPGEVVHGLIKDRWEASEDDSTLVHTSISTYPPRTVLRGTFILDNEMTSRMVFKRVN